jgi:hypothetical protein
MLPLKSSLPRFRIHPIGIGIGIVLLLLAMNWLFRNPNANFRSSDANWAGGEVTWKGLDFDSIAFSFETYRLNCHAESAQLVRTTKMRWWNVFAWPSYSTNPKWKVPYGKPDPRIGSLFPRSATHCANRGLTSEDRTLVKQRSMALVLFYDGA